MNLLPATFPHRRCSSYRPVSLFISGQISSVQPKSETPLLHQFLCALTLDHRTSGFVHSFHSVVVSSGSQPPCSLASREVSASYHNNNSKPSNCHNVVQLIAVLIITSPLEFVLCRQLAGRRRNQDKYLLYSERRRCSTCFC